ncbi:exodeoxyribonuclease III [Sediminitomix flava]|uniref:Exodeoxyribonuclease-3 n=1 Tax=Sediminitomix flava TaxID=379075 RepID=A0A315Z0F2_SEDFL|nr:exodeoxyribonuclease III [Sediminitomix flava]PWJ36108.1 exodeoxyribonuclease-3 [Sediminitomix flava]
MKLITYNVNGIRAAVKKGFLEWLAEENPDVICLQEVKALEEQGPIEELKALGYHHIYWHSAEKKGYSGVAIISKVEPKAVQFGQGIELYDAEGRTLIAEFDDFTLVNTYFPSGSSGDERQDFKMKFLADYQVFIDELKAEKGEVVVCGDFNICHEAIDIHNPVRLKNTSGFLPEEREWVTQFLSSGFIDCFRTLHKEEADRYSWWSYRAGARGKNLGWRIDYFMATNKLEGVLKESEILSDVVHSDHCPVRVELG